MHHLLRILFLLFPILPLTAQSLVTAEIQHGNDAQTTPFVTADADGNILAAVNFWDDLDADPGPGIVNFNVVGSMDVAILKLDPAGNYIWGKQLGGAGFQSISDMATDAAGNVYVFGYFNGTMDMDPGPGTANITSAGSDDLFVGKYSAAGNLVWAYKFGGTGTEQNYGFDIDADGDPVVHGYFQNTVDFDPGPGTYNLTAGVSGSTFLLKLHDDGTLNYAMTMGAFYGNQLRIDNADNIYITGLFWGTIDFDPGLAVYNLSATGFNNDAFVLKLSPTGVFNWAGVISGNNGEQGTDLVIDEINNTITIAGFYEGTADADPGPGTSNLVSAGYIDAFIVQWNASTGGFIWAKSMGGPGYQASLSIDQTSGGTLHIAGSFEQTADFDGGPAVNNLTSSGSTDIFKTSYTDDGIFISAEKIGSTAGDGAACLRIDNTGAVLLSGYFDGIVDFDPGPDTYNLNSAFTGWDGFIAKYCTVYTINTNVQICAGESYFAGGAWQTEPGEYYDYFTPAEGCDSIVITHLSISTPIADLGTDIELCAGETTILDAENPGATYLWNTGATTQTITVNSAGIYSVTVTDPAGCTATDAVAVNVVSAPVVNLGPNQSICAGEFVILNAGNPGATYLWNTGATTQTITVNEEGNYSVTVTNAFGCADNDLIHITVNPDPIVTLEESIAFCEGSTIVLDAGNPGATYLWSTGAVTQTISVNTTGDFSVEVTNAEGCSTTAFTSATALPLPIVELGADLALCEGESVILDATIPGAEYTWSTGEATPSITVTESGTYSVVVVDDNGCENTDAITIIVNPTPDVDLGGDAAYCADEEVILDATYPGASYVWSTGAETPTISVTEDGYYSVTVTSASGCTGSDEVNITIHPLPVADLGEDVTTCANVPVLLDATTPSCTYLWNTGATTATIWADTAGVYSVDITNSFGCRITDSVTVMSLPVPEVSLVLPFIELCADATAVALTGGSPAGGNYFGEGIADGLFDPALSGLGTFNVYYAFTDLNGCSDTAAQSITVTICQDMHDLPALSVQLYPNPSMDILHISISDPGHWDYYEITDQTGRVWLGENVTQALETVRVEQLPSGHYILLLRNDTHTIRKQFIVVH